MKNILSKISVRNKKVLWYSVCAGFVFTFCSGLYSMKSYSDTMQGNISREVVRYHVLANSDSDEDQLLKMAVKDTVLNYYHDDLLSCDNKEDTLAFLTGNLPEIEHLARTVVQDYGYDYPVTASLSYDYFPTKTYGDASFPAGMYDALRIEIGAAEGRNWWCLMFPPLCYVDVTYDELTTETKEELKTLLDDDAYDLVMQNQSQDIVPVEVKFKLVELWQERS